MQLFYILFSISAFLVDRTEDKIEIRVDPSDLNTNIFDLEAQFVFKLKENVNPDIFFMVTRTVFNSIFGFYLQEIRPYIENISNNMRVNPSLCNLNSRIVIPPFDNVKKDKPIEGMM